MADERELNHESVADALHESHGRSRISEFTLLEFLGEGATAQVYLAEHEVSKCQVAIKVIDKLLVQRSQLESKVQQEMVLHAELSHPHVLHVEDVFEDARNYYMVLEYCAKRSLSAIVKTLPGRKMDEATAKKVFRQVVAGVAYLHGSGVIHRDLKLANLLVSAQGEVKISDFGLAARLSDDHATMCGTPNFIAPEVLASDGEPYDEAVDVWSLGCILYCLLFGKAPFEGRKVSETLENVANAGQKPLKFPEGFSASASDLIKRLLVSEPRNRPTAQQILLHPWLREASQRRVPPTSGRRKSVPQPSSRPQQSTPRELSHSPDEKLRESRRAAVIRSMKEEMSASSSSSASLPRRAAPKVHQSLERSRTGTTRHGPRGPLGSKMANSRLRSLVSTLDHSDSSSSPDDASVNITDDYSDLSHLSVAASIDYKMDGGNHEAQDKTEVHADAGVDPALYASRSVEPVVSVIMHLELADVAILGLPSSSGGDSRKEKVEAEWKCMEPAEVGSPPSFTLAVSNGWEVRYDPASDVITGTTPDGDLIRYAIPGVSGTEASSGSISNSSQKSTVSVLSCRAVLPALVWFCQCLALRTMQLRSIALRGLANKLPLIHYDKIPESLLESFRYRSRLLSTISPSTQQVYSDARTANPQEAVNIHGVGRGFIDETGDLRVEYLDGARLTLAASGLQLRFRPAWANDNRSEDVFELLTTSSMSAYLPSVVKQKLESIPEFIRRLKAVQ